MISFDNVPKLFMISGDTDLRKGINGYADIIQNKLNLKPMDSNSLFIFCNKHHNKIKCLYWDGYGFWLLYKRNEKGTFKWIKDNDGYYQITHQQLRWLLEGLKVVQNTAFEKQNREFV